MSSQPTDEDVLHTRIPAEAMRLVEAARGRSLHLRVTGSMAVRLHSQKYAGLLDGMGRRLFRDIDFWAYLKEQRDLERLFESDGYVADETIKRAREWGVKRLLYLHPQTHVKIDVFMDELVMSHTIDFKGRLDLEFPTVGLTDLLLSKLQIHEITENDLIDVIVLVAEHDLGGASATREQIDGAHIAELMRGDWGFCYTTLENLAKCEAAVSRYPQLDPALAGLVHGRLQSLRARIEQAPKTTRWKLRGRVGTRTRWYEEVGDVDR